MNDDRTINFGKYKGTAIKQLILEHIGYIHWCLGNLEWFKLNADEQALYDAVAIANIKYEIDLVFPVRELAKFIADKDKYSKLDTPFIISRDGVIRYAIKDVDNPIISGALKYKDDNPIMLTSDNGLQLKSKIMGISTISLKNFLKR